MLLHGHMDVVSCAPPPANSTHTLHSLVIEHLVTAHVAMCKSSLQELKYWKDHDFPHAVPLPNKPSTVLFLHAVRVVWCVVVCCGVV